MSMIVAKNGPAENAGSRFNRLSKNGIQLPNTDDIRTMHVNATLATIVSRKLPPVR